MWDGGSWPGPPLSPVVAGPALRPASSTFLIGLTGDMVTGTMRRSTPCLRGQADAIGGARGSDSVG